MSPFGQSPRILPLALLIGLESFFVAGAGTEPREAIAQDTARSVVVTSATIDAREAPRPSGPVVLLVMDGVRWNEVFEGADPELAAERHMDVSALRKPEQIMPNLVRLMGRGVALGAPGHGAPPVTSGTSVSLPGYIEIFTGHRKVPCADNGCGKPHLRTIVDELRYYVDKPDDVAVVSSWPVIMNAAALAPSKVAISTGRGGGSNRGLFRYDATAASLLWHGDDADKYPGDDKYYRPDEYTSKIATRYLAAKKPRFMFIGLGDGDEYAHRLDYQDYLKSLAEQDRTVGEVMDILDHMGERGKATTLIVTVDHGRGKDFAHHGAAFPGSERVWMVAAGGQVPQRGFADPKEARRLADLAPTVRRMLGLPPVDDGENAGKPIPEFFADD